MPRASPRPSTGRWSRPRRSDRLGPSPDRRPTMTASSSGLPRTTSTPVASSRRTGAASTSDHSRRRRLTSRLTCNPASRARSRALIAAADAVGDKAGVMPVRWSHLRAVEDAIAGGAVHVVRAQAGACRTGAVVDDSGRAQRATFAEHHAGRRVGIDREVVDVDAFATQPPQDGGPEAVRRRRGRCRRPSVRVERARPRRSPRRRRCGARRTSLPPAVPTSSPRAMRGIRRASRPRCVQGAS